MIDVNVVRSLGSDDFIVHIPFFNMHYVIVSLCSLIFNNDCVYQKLSHKIHEILTIISPVHHCFDEPPGAISEDTVSFYYIFEKYA